MHNICVEELKNMKAHICDHQNTCFIKLGREEHKCLHIKILILLSPHLSLSKDLGLKRKRKWESTCSGWRWRVGWWWLWLRQRHMNKIFIGGRCKNCSWRWWRWLDGRRQPLLHKHIHIKQNIIIEGFEWSFQCVFDQQIDLHAFSKEPFFHGFLQVGLLKVQHFLNPFFKHTHWSKVVKGVISHGVLEVLTVAKASSTMSWEMT